MTRLLKTLAVLALLSLVAGLLLACGEDEDIANGNQGGSQPTPTATSPTATPAAPSTEPPATPATETPAPQLPPSSPTTTPDHIDHPTGADRAIIRIEQEGGFVPQQYLLTRLPLFLLDGRGCVITQGPMIEIFPQPALPNLLETCLQEEGVQLILEAAREAGLLEGDAHYPMDTIADATTTVFTLNADGKTIRVSAYALAEGSDEYITGKNAEQQKAARKKLSEFLARLGDLQSWLPPNIFVSIEQPYQIERLQLVFLPTDSRSAPQVDAGQQQQEIEWPLAGDLAEFGAPYFIDGYRCGVIEGQDLATVMAELPAANQLTPWTSGDNSYYLYLRPLLAGEEGCAEPAM